MFDENVTELSLSESHLSFALECKHYASLIAQRLAHASVPFNVETKIDETSNEWRFRAPRYALGLLRTL